MIHDFETSLRMSQAQSDAPWWGDVYRKAFPAFSSMTYVAKDGWAQRGGIDRVVTLNSGKSICVDEKVRKEDYSDILLERWSNEARRSPGWIQKDLACDFIAYAFIPSRTCYLLPFLTLRRAWLDHGRSWIGLFQEVRAKNNGYVTVSVAVPMDILFGALDDAMRVKWVDRDLSRTA